MFRPTARTKRTFLTVLAVIVGLFVTATLVTASLWPVLNVVETGKTPQYPDALPQYFSADPKRVYDEAERAIVALDSWRVVIPNAEAGRIEAEHETAVVGFVDDVSITITAETEFVSRVDVRSASRVGRGDFGQNARNIRAFQAELDRRLGAVRFDPYAAAEPDSP